MSAGERSPRSFQRYNKNAKYEQELLRDEERRLFNRVKRVARKRSGADVLMTSRDCGDVSSTDEPTDLTMTSQLLNDGDRRRFDDGDVNAAMTSCFLPSASTAWSETGLTMRIFILNQYQ